MNSIKLVATPYYLEEKVINLYTFPNILHFKLSQLDLDNLIVNKSMDFEIGKINIGVNKIILYYLINYYFIDANNNLFHNKNPENLFLEYKNDTFYIWLTVNDIFFDLELYIINFRIFFI
jgi:hypothetical protein